MLWGGKVIYLGRAVNVYVFAPLRWKQHEAYVQVLEAKYTELCCKYICCYVNVIQYNASNSPYVLRATFGCLWKRRFFWCASLSPSSLRRLSQWCDRAEGVGGEAQAAAAGVCTQGEHLGHATCHQGAGNARVHGTCLFLHFNAFDGIMGNFFFLFVSKGKD